MWGACRSVKGDGCCAFLMACVSGAVSFRARLAFRAPGPAFGRPNLIPTIVLSPSMGFALPRCALQGQPSVVQICSRQICVEPKWFSSDLSPSPIKNALSGALYASGESRERGLFGPSMGLTPPRYALRGQPSAVQICSRQICRTEMVLIRPLSLPPIKKRPCGRFFMGGGERGIRTLDKAFDPILP
jgi:hypothetical protein